MIAVDAIVAGLVLLGSGFILLGAVGIVRMPDLYTRMQAATKAGTLGVACVLLAAGVHFQSNLILVEAVLAIVFLFATAPIASHMIARAAYAGGTPLWDKTTRDDLLRDLESGRVTCASFQQRTGKRDAAED